MTDSFNNLIDYFFLQHSTIMLWKLQTSFHTSFISQLILIQNTWNEWRIGKSWYSWYWQL